MNIQELMQRCGSSATEAEAVAMAQILKARGFEDIEDLDQLTDDEFFSLIPEAIKRAKEAS